MLYIVLYFAWKCGGVASCLVVLILFFVVSMNNMFVNETELHEIAALRKDGENIVHYDIVNQRSVSNEEIDIFIKDFIIKGLSSNSAWRSSIDRSHPCSVKSGLFALLQKKK